MKTCIACGMPMNEEKDFALGDKSKDYCVHCCNKDGTMHNYEQAVEAGTQFYMQSKNMEYEVAKKECIEYFKTMPAWKSR